MYYSTSANFPYYVGPKIYLILYPSVGNLTTHIAIEYTSKQNRSYLGINIHNATSLFTYLIGRRQPHKKVGFLT